MSVPVTVIVALQVPTVDAVFVTTPGQLSVAVVAAMAAASAPACVGKQAAIMPAVTVGGVLSMRVAYVTLVLLLQASVPVTVMMALHVPLVMAESITGGEQRSLAPVAAIAAAWAAATVG